MPNTKPKSSDSTPTRSQLFDKMRREFGDRGTYSCGMFEKGEFLLEQAKQDPFMAYPAAYCFRQALVELFPNARRSISWNVASRKVVTTKDHIQDRQPFDPADLKNLCGAINELREIHQGDKLHEARLAQFIKSRTGQEHQKNTSTLLRDYQKIIDDLNELSHKVSKPEQNTTKDVCDCYDRAIDFLEILFIPDDRKKEVIRLAKLSNPDHEDAKQLKKHLVSPSDFAWFAQNILDPTWFKILDPKMLEPVEGSVWSISYISKYLKPEHINAFAELIEANMSEWMKSDAGFKGLCSAANILRDRGRRIMLKLLHKDHKYLPLCVFAYTRYLEVDPSDRWIAKVANMLLKPDSGLNDYYKHEILSKLVDGIDLSSAKERIEILSYSIKNHIDNNQHIFIHQYENLDQQRPIIHRVENAFVKSLCDALLKSKRLGSSTLDLAEWVAPLPDMLKSRFVAWLYSKANDIDCSVLTDFVVEAIGDRAPTGDDLLLLDRLIRDCDIETHGRLEDALGAAPKPRETDDYMRRSRRTGWAIAIGDGIALPGWESTLEVLKQKGITRASMSPPTVHMFTGSTTRSELIDFDTADPYNLATMIASYRSNTQSGMNIPSVVDICNDLEIAVKKNPDRWIEDPIRIIMTLEHPTYVAGYLRGLANTDKPLGANVDLLVQAVQFSCTHPWPAIPLDPLLFDYDNDWQNVDIAGMDLIEALIKKDVVLSDESISNAWDVICSVAASDEPDEMDNDNKFDTTRNFFEDAINDPRTRAVQILIYLIVHAKRHGCKVPDKALAVLTRALKLTGEIGAKHRAVIAAHVRFLRDCLPDWFEQNEALLFGNEAPVSLARISLDNHMKWEYPDEYVLNNYLKKILEGVERDVPYSMNHLLTGMFWSIDGYEPKSLATELVKMGPKYVSLAGEYTAMMLKDSDDDGIIQRGVSLWQCVLNLSPEPNALLGYGQWSRVASLDQSKWESLTLQTCERTKGVLDWPWNIAERIGSADVVTDAGLRILIFLIKSDLNVFDAVQVERYASAALSKTKDIDELQTSWQTLYDIMLERGYHPDSQN